MHDICTWNGRVALAACLLLQGCVVCVNGRGIGCSVPAEMTLERAWEERASEDRKTADQIANSFLAKLIRAAQDDPEAGEFDPPTEDQRKRLELMLDDVLKAIHERARAHTRSKEFRVHFDLGDTLVRPRAKVTARQVSPAANCTTNTIEVPIRFLRGVLAHSFEQGARGKLKTPLIPKGAFYPGSISKHVAASPTGQFAQSAALVNTMAYRAILFAMAHESAHLWSRRCEIASNSDLQRKKEALADLFASIVASEIYSGSCMKAPFVVSGESLEQIYRNQYVPRESLGQLVANRMAEMDLNRFLVGGEGDVQLLFSAIDADVDSPQDDHPFVSNRVSVDTSTRRLLVRQYYDDLDKEVKSSWLVKLFVPEEVRDVLYESMKVGFAGIDYREFTSDDLMACSVASFKSTVLSSPP